VLFLDVSETPGKQASDSEDGHEFFERWIATLSVVLADHGGMLIRSVGPTLRCSFVKADEAVHCGTVLEQTVTANSRAPKLRGGIHIGEVVLAGESYSGEGVTTAARMAMLAGPGQVVCTQTVYEKTSDGLRQKLCPFETDSGNGGGGNGTLYLLSNGQKSKRAPRQLPPQRQQPGSAARANKDVRTRRRVVLKKSHIRKRTPAAVTPDGATVVETVPAAQPVYRPEPAPKTHHYEKMCLVTATGKAMTLDQSRPCVSLGRSPENDIVCNVDSASRRHAEIQWRDGQFLLIDHSRNGTLFYSDKDKETHFVHEEEAALIAPSGTISPGRRLLDPGGERLMYWIEK
jgi:hypothetical protein